MNLLPNEDTSLGQGMVVPLMQKTLQYPFVQPVLYPQLEGPVLFCNLDRAVRFCNAVKEAEEEGAESLPNSAR